MVEPQQFSIDEFRNVADVPSRKSQNDVLVTVFGKSGQTVSISHGDVMDLVECRGRRPDEYMVHRIKDFEIFLRQRTLSDKDGHRFSLTSRAKMSLTFLFTPCQRFRKS